MPASSVRLGMIGGGSGAFIGKVHRQAAALAGGIELVAGAFSRDPANNAETGREAGLQTQRVYASWQALLDGEARLDPGMRINLLAIVTPNHLHAPIAAAAIRAGIHVFCEKPAALSSTETHDLAHLLVQSDVLYGLAHTYQGYPMIWQARHMVQAGEIGRVRKLYVEYPQGWLSDDLAGQGNKQAAWRGDPQLAGQGGCIGDIGTHAFSLAEFVSGQRIECICAHLGTHVPGRTLDDDCAMLFLTEQDASGVLLASQVCAGEENALKIRIYGDKGGLEWRQEEPNSLIHRSLDQPMRVLRAGANHSWLCAEALHRIRLPAGHPEGYLEAMANLYSDFAQAIGGSSGAAAALPGIETGKRGMAFIEAALASHASEAKWTALSPTEGAR
ncbi:Gfo/Idh/MocA family protein [Phytopseudomonas daroniae]|uniref:Gfo/Idh/MocA family protein n=1 Tax=Phytopseudomonas daroniae TaxID=2487519 RepID=UPI0010382D85|nr:Gfo/Idh/MocA family oxidoreductase [Pseudomonas daroniae]TBU78413.1 oxidoreductase [Pseudomonas daroniae]